VDSLDLKESPRFPTPIHNSSFSLQWLSTLESAAR
jgi:hypothetical protein